ncbi:hypothetical protein RTBOTA2_006534 [Rhodotorula toruloides]|nr:hypothetical protein RTBOTA2_006534 [Rhodotorula toruloides]
MPGRAASSPSVFGVSGLKTPYTWPPTPPTTMELEGPALKKILLANLRTRMANGGSGSTAAEVGLRFAVWNAWNRRPQEPLDEVDEPEAEPAPEVHGAYDSALFSDDDDDADNPDTVDDELALPDPPAELVNEGEPADLLLASDGSSGTLDPSYDGFEAEPSTAAPPLARPTLRRTTSLPNISLGEHSDAGDSRSSSSGKYTYRQEQDPLNTPATHRERRTTMQIKIKTLTGKEVSLPRRDPAERLCRPLEIELDIEPTYTAQKIKEQLEEKEGIPPAQQRLIFLGKAMPDEKTAQELKIEAGSTLHLILSLRGGRC